MTEQKSEDPMIAVHVNYDGIPDSKVNGANMGLIWGHQDPGGPHVGPMNFAIWDDIEMLSALLALCEGIPPVTSGFPPQKVKDHIFLC